MRSVDLKEIQELQKEVEQFDGISLKLNWDMLRSSASKGENDFFVRRDGRIIAFLGLYDFGAHLEICGMVAPAYRRKGIFTSLMKEALPKERAVLYEHIWLNSPAASLTGQAFITFLKAEFGFAEYQMKYNPLYAGSELLNDKVQLRPAAPFDRELLIELDVLGFKESPEVASEMYERQSEEKDSVTFVVELDGQPAGKLHVNYEAEKSWIYGFVIHPDLRGRGIGSSALNTIVKQEFARGKGVLLEVALDNPRALQLYEACGFEKVGTQNYYSYRP